MSQASPLAATLHADMAAKEQKRFFPEKLRRLIEANRLSRSEVDATAGLPTGSVSTYITRKTVPQPHSALKLESGLRALGVDVDFQWLFDEDQESTEPRLVEEISAHDRLRQEDPHVVADVAAENYRKYAAQLYRATDKANEPDWDGIAIWLLWTGPTEELPEPMRDALRLLWAIDSTLYAVRALDVLKQEAIAAAGERVEPGYASSNLERSELEDKLSNIENKQPGVTALGEFIQAVPVDWLRRTLTIEASASPFGVFPFKSRPVEDTDEFKSKRVPYLLARLISDPGYFGRPKLQPIVEHLQSHGYLDGNGEVVSIPGYDFEVNHRQGWQ